MAHHGLRHALLGQVGAAGGLIEQPGHIHHGVVVDGHHHVGILDVVNPRHVLVADAFNAMRPEAVLEQGGALQRLAGHNLAAGEELLHIVAAGDGAGRAGG